MFYAALTFYVLFLACYGLFAAAILFHFQKYRAPGETHATITKIFLLAITLLAIISFIAFMQVSWENISFTIPSNL